jgi:tetratricopeptide (TPR) repeat protein
LLAEAAANQDLGNIEEAVSQYELYLQKFPTDPQVSFVKPLVAALRREAAKRTTAKTTPGSAAKTESNDDYFADTTAEVTTRWLPKRMPIKVYIPSEAECKNIPGYNPIYGKELRESFDEWQTKSNDTVRFAFVNDSDKADLTCEWTDDPTKVRQPVEGGEAPVIFDRIHGIRTARIILLTKHADNSMPPTANLIRAVAQHEIGHSLGLIGHSPAVGDVMFFSLPSGDTRRSISNRDIKTLVHLYRPDVALSDGTAPGEMSDNSARNALNNEGIKLNEEHKYKEASEKFEAALKVDPQFEAGRSNLAACLNNLAIDAVHSSDFEGARKTFLRALELAGDKGDPSQRSAMLQNLASVCDRLGKNDEAQEARAKAKQLAGK